MEISKTYRDFLKTAGKYVLYAGLTVAAASSLYAGYQYIKERNLRKAEEFCLDLLAEQDGSLEDLAKIPPEDLLLLAPPGYNLSCGEIFRMRYGPSIQKQEKAEQQSL